jgi:hypothetical protein
MGVESLKKITLPNEIADRKDSEDGQSRGARDETWMPSVAFREIRGSIGLFAESASLREIGHHPQTPEIVGLAREKRNEPNRVSKLET